MELKALVKAEKNRSAGLKSELDAKHDEIAAVERELTAIRARNLDKKIHDYS